MGCIALVRCVLVLRCGLAQALCFSLHPDTTPPQPNHNGTPFSFFEGPTGFTFFYLYLGPPNVHFPSASVKKTRTHYPSSPYMPQAPHTPPSLIRSHDSYFLEDPIMKLHVM